ncbi:uncharacterized protein LOC111008628 isoform X1 [Momordica charantia]|uniref:Uncharacterized protein LOC111008628 isoform X1 n=1 Tax=Momordica charantia TaxID=3673 RepID=A0A6J1C5M3_MOMCH|nr:uncharacterized protein LOC111008628 isoform X1 [Momordica charantia]
MVAMLIPSCLNPTPKLGHWNRPPILSALCKHQRGARLEIRGVARPQILPSAFGEDNGLRVFVLSDMHTDYAENMNWIKCLSSVNYRDDVLLIAGDVAETYTNFVSTMALLKDRFQRVFFVPGNHDLWCRREGGDCLDSLEKMSKLLDACRGLGVDTNPAVLNELGIIPLFSWYHESFDREVDIRTSAFHLWRWCAKTSMLASGLENFQMKALP